MATLSGAFRGYNTFFLTAGAPAVGIVNVADVSLGSGMTLGSTLIDPVPSQVPLGPSWQILGWSIAIYMALFQETSQQVYGRLGQLYGGLCTTANTTNGTTPYTSPVQPFPPDVSMISLIWDGTQDPAPPSFSNSSQQPTLTPTVGTLQFPEPLSLSAGDQLSIGLWLTPSVVSLDGLLLALNGTWTISYQQTTQPANQGLWT